MTDKAAPRGFPWMWYIRFVQILLTLIVLAVAAQVAAAINNGDTGDCHVPSKVAWNIVCVCSSVNYKISDSDHVCRLYLLLLPWYIFYWPQARRMRSNAFLG